MSVLLVDGREDMTDSSGANVAKMLAARSMRFAADRCVQTRPEFGLIEEYDVKRKFRETRRHQAARIPTCLIFSHVARHVLNLPKSF